MAADSALGVPGFEPSISRELNVVDAAIGSMIGDPLSASAFLVLGLASGLLTTAMAARSLEDPDLLRRSNIVMTIVVVIAAAGAWGVGRRLFQKSPALHPPAKLGIDRS